ncbi:MAG: FecCD family ABC transporter permease [bacterium]
MRPLRPSITPSRVKLKPLNSLLILLLLTILLSALAVLTGPSTHFYELVLSPDAWSSAIVTEIRIPRVLVALFCGACLATAGVLMQVLLRNPLADPYILGLSGGSSLAVMLSMSAGAGIIGQQLAGSAGALISTLLVFILARGAGAWTPTRLILTGIILASGWSALISLTLSLAADQNLRSMLFWMMGDLAQAHLSLTVTSVGVLAFAASWLLSPRLNVLSQGFLLAQSLGENVRRLEYYLFILAALLTGVCVVIAGSVGFIGLVVPHFMRMLLGYDHRWLIPASALAGGSLLVICDTLARTISQPMQLPTGVITAIIGVPVFLWMLNRNRAYGQ